MTISSRTPEGLPGNCPLCGASTNIEYSRPGEDAPCPNCGCLLWLSGQLLHTVIKVYEDALGTTPGRITANTRLADLAPDSLDAVEILMALEEQFDIQIPDDAAERIQTIGDFVRYLERQRRGAG